MKFAVEQSFVQLIYPHKKSTDRAASFISSTQFLKQIVAYFAWTNHRNA